MRLPQSTALMPKHQTSEFGGIREYTDDFPAGFTEFMASVMWKTLLTLAVCLSWSSPT